MNDRDRRKPQRLLRVVLLFLIGILAARGIFANDEVGRRISATTLIFAVPALVFALVQLARSRPQL